MLPPQSGYKLPVLLPAGSDIAAYAAAAEWL